MMDRLQGLGPLNSCFIGDHFEVNCFEQDVVDVKRLRFVEDEQQLMISSLEDNMPFLQMLQSVESTPHIFPYKEASFRTLLSLQNMKKQQPWERTAYIQTAMELESCVTHDILEIQSPMKSESNELQQQTPSCVEKMMSYDECNHAIIANANTQSCHETEISTREKRKRKRTRPTKNKEDVENQRMTHIAVERNRRRQMNDHLSVLRSLVPPSYIQRGDQASIIGGAIDFVKELEQLLQSLEVQKMMRKNEESGNGSASNGLCKPAGSLSSEEAKFVDEVRAEMKSNFGHIEVTLIQTHVNLKIECQRRPSQLIKVILALEDLRLTILHLNITSSVTSVLYSLNLKVSLCNFLILCYLI
ncbi:putative transcription factor bHLH family [Lupinus albus]|uniref:Putative transcription factor bHLH family n=1 Tax=Lupinus albus TaxID=3870 RepID=A0A6A4PVN4_LUPAL|nr:putative transcription factor bHLH family [Lupinus albus]